MQFLANNPNRPRSIVKQRIHLSNMSSRGIMELSSLMAKRAVEKPILWSEGLRVTNCKELCLGALDMC